jgi:hypothetical protein
LVDLGIDDNNIISASLQYGLDGGLSVFIYEEEPSTPWLRAVHVGFVVDKEALRQVSRISVVPCQ